jgi:hypothetical protein
MGNHDAKYEHQSINARWVKYCCNILFIYGLAQLKGFYDLSGVISTKL